MWRLKVKPPVLWCKAIGDRSEHSQPLRKPNHGALSITVSQAELSQCVVQTPFVLQRPGTARPSQPILQNLPVLRVIDRVCQQDLTHCDAPTELDRQGPRPNTLHDTCGHGLQAPFCILLGSDQLQFDLDDR